MKSSSVPKESSRGGWKDLYIAALFENDKARLAERIAIAQLAIGSRRQELLMSRNDPRERQHLDNALSRFGLAGSPRLEPHSNSSAQSLPQSD
jgi:hypothetical protein